MKHDDYNRANGLSGEVIGAAIEVHRVMGPGLLEDIYEKCMMRELQMRGIAAEQQVPVHVEYKGVEFDSVLRIDICVEDCLLLELKSLERVLPIHKAQLLSYMKLLDVPLGLLLNFHCNRLRDGISRLILDGADGDATGPAPF